MKFANRMSRIIRRADMFGIPNSLVLGRTLIYRSKFSGILSIFIYIILVVVLSVEIEKTLKKFVLFNNPSLEIKHLFATLKYKKVNHLLSLLIIKMFSLH